VDKNSTSYVLLFVVSMTVIVALSLTGVREFTKETAERNEAIFNKRAILASVNDYLGMGEGITAKELTDPQVLDIFKDKVQQLVIDTKGNPIDNIQAENIKMEKEAKKDESERSLPLFIYEYDGQKFFILSVRGKGLWDDIWGYIALKEDASTIAGASFDHKGETPGLGAEIKDNPTFSNNFKDRQIFRDGEFVSVLVRKGGARDKIYEVDGITGATVTADGVDKMLRSGIALYLPLLNEQRNNK